MTLYPYNAESDIVGGVPGLCEAQTYQLPAAGLLGSGHEIVAPGSMICISLLAVVAVIVELLSIAFRPSCKTTNSIVFHCQRAIPNSIIPKTSVSRREMVIAASTAVAPSSHPRLGLLHRIAI